MKKNKLFWILTVGCVLNFAAHLYFYPSLPDIVPTHWGASGQVNGWGPKSTILILPLAQEIDEVIKHLDEYRKAIRAGDREELTILLRDGRERKERLG